jgi:alpha-tubulin suppressor-like RCC1 family protein
MKTSPINKLLQHGSGFLILGTSLAVAQQMPQDTWRYDGVEIASPEPANYLRCIAVGSGGIYVGEGSAVSSTATQLLRFNSGGGFVSRFNTAFTFIVGIACDAAGNVYVLDRGPSKVRVFDQDGQFLREWGGPGTADGQFNSGSATAYNMIAIDQNNEIYVCDPGNSRIQVFDTNGNFLRKWGEPGSLPGQFAFNDPKGIVVAPDDRVIVDCGSAPHLRIFDTQGRFLSSHSISLNSMCVLPDGILVGHRADGVPGTSFYDNNYELIASNYQEEAGSLGLAANRAGDFFRVLSNPKVVRINEREYDTVHNALLPTAIPQPVITHLLQRSGVPVLDVDYMVTDADSPTVTTAALAFLNGNNTLAGAIPMTTFLDGTAANLGPNQPSNTTRRLSWDMAADWSVDFGSIQVEIMAKDERNPLGVHWITLPAEGGNPAVEVSRSPVRNSNLLSIWYWFVANKESGMSFASGEVRGAGGIYGTELLASGTNTTNFGRLFALEKLGMRTITDAEKARAKAGNYGFSSVTDESVVREATGPGNLLYAWGSDPSNYGHTNITPGLFRAGIVSVAAGSSFSLVVTDSGWLSAMGANHQGQLGDGTTTTQRDPVLVSGGVAQAAAGSIHSLFVKTDGTLWAMGYNGAGQLGDGTTANRSNPVQVASGTAKVAAGDAHSLFIKTDGTLWSMGYNVYGQLGDGAETNRNTPVQVASDVAQVAAAGSHSLFVKTDGTLWAMGYNGFGQLGDGTNISRNTPVQVASGVAQAAAGHDHSLFIKTDGTLWAMGGNDQGQLGDGSNTNRSTPVQVVADVAQVAAGSSHTLFIKTDGTLWATGYNASGQLGDGTTSNRNSPVRSGTDSNWVRVAAGSSHTIAVRGNF